MNQTNRPDGIAARPVARATVKATIVFLLALAITMTSVAAPVRAGNNETQTIDSVRATVTGTYTYKIGLLSDLKAGTDNPDKIAVYAAGIAELTALRDGNVVTEPTIDGLWALKERAHAIYGETVSAARNAGMSDAEILQAAKDTVADKIDLKIKLLTDWIAACDLTEAPAVVATGISRLNALRPELEAVTTPDAAWAIKDRVYAIYGTTKSDAEKIKVGNEGECDDDKAGDKTDAQKAAEALAQARRTTLTLIARKTAIFNAAAAAARVPAVVDIFETAARSVADLEADTRAAKTIKALKAIRGQVMDIYETAKKDVAAVTNREAEEGESDDVDDAGRTIEGHLDGVRSYVMNIVDRVEASTQESSDTYASLIEAKMQVLTAADAVQAVVESGNRLDDRWQDLRDALTEFRRAVIRHYIATSDGPMFLGGFHIAG